MQYQTHNLALVAFFALGLAVEGEEPEAPSGFRVEENRPAITITLGKTGSGVLKVGQTATFVMDVKLFGRTPPPGYQWYKNNKKIEGAASSTYTTPPVTLDDNMSFYQCRSSSGERIDYDWGPWLVVYDQGEKLVDWVKVTEVAEWSPRDSLEPLVYKDRVWLMGGWPHAGAVSPRDVWSSADGKSWNLVLKQAPFTCTDMHMTVVFDNKMWEMGGCQVTSPPVMPTPFSNAVWWSSDGVKWEQATAQAGWTPRAAAALVTFKDKMWIMGGGGNVKSKLMNDVWCSSDGAKWELVTPHAPWSPRSDHRTAVLNGKLYLFGGRGSSYNDVWSTVDGIRWTKETDAAPWRPRHWFQSVVYRDRMWILGGTTGSSLVNAPDVWHSKDGKNWKQLKSHVGPLERHAHGAWVSQDKIFVAGGSIEIVGTSATKNSVYSLEVPMDYFKE